MYRLMIADDEALEREGLEWIVRRAMPDTFQIIHAENGRAAIGLAEEHRPHIIFMDVNMPGIQGLEALKEIKARMPDAKLVLVTAYDYFAYAKEAISLGVEEYIVKPAKREELVSLLHRLVDELDQEKARREEELEMRDRMSQLMPLAENELALLLMMNKAADEESRQLSEWLDFPLDRGLGLVVAFHDEMNIGRQKVYNVIHSLLRTFGSSISSSIIDRHVAVFLRMPPDMPETEFNDEVHQYGEKLRSHVEQHFGLSAAIGIGTVREGAEGLHESYFEAVFASTLGARNGEICHFGDLKKEDFDFTDRNPAAVNQAGERSYVVAALERIREEREQQTMSVMDKAKRYIGLKFTEELSLEEVADHVHLNPFYFSKIFKQLTGETFIDYLTSLRIGKAKELIAAGDLSLKEVTYLAGYKDPNYFSRVFKKVTGVTPSEYREQIN
ncbi:two-component system, response regulator YesN [Paenibacillus sophorae]|uniref:AraC family transcriptional regulator n=1 Tax=Paenibacillus sophorae TaxID=1333845 RepID=A0A1H8M3L7_9BACL|nr:AraC family transcriptional regulator [Paenibacillus sophorae]QWU17660.1 AraC family transcriptional regulator [Paenibacillus sophorae]SEO11974.1 two-component system, response regulator YesN [Paenibacillus sophorae]